MSDRPPGCECDKLPAGLVLCQACRANPGWVPPPPLPEGWPMFEFKFDTRRLTEDDRYELRQELRWLVKRAAGTSAHPAYITVADQLAQLAEVDVTGGRPLRVDMGGLDEHGRECLTSVLRMALVRVGTDAAGRPLRLLVDAWERWLWPHGRPAPKKVKTVERRGMWTEIA